MFHRRYSRSLGSFLILPSKIRTMPILYIPILVIVILLLAWTVRTYVLSKRAHPHDLTRQYAKELKESSIIQDITLSKAIKNKPMWISGTYKDRPLLMTVMTLYKKRSEEHEFHIHGYMSALRISVPAQRSGQDSVVVYRETDSVLWKKGQLEDIAKGSNFDVLSSQDKEAIAQFIEEYGALRYRTRTDISTLIVPNDMWNEQKMVVSHERFYSKTSLDEIFYILDGLHHLAEVLEQP